MMLTVSMTDIHFLLKLKMSQVSVALNRFLKVLIVTNTQNHSVEATPPPWLGVEIMVHIEDSWYICSLIPIHGSSVNSEAYLGLATHVTF